MRSRTIVAAGLAGGLLALAAPAAANAASALVTGTISGTTLSLGTTAAPTFSANLDTGDQTPTYPVPLSVQDTRGTGGGWNLTITSTQFTTGAPNNYTLATNASSMTTVGVANGSGTNTAPSDSVTYPVAVPAGTTPPSAVKFFNATSGTGLGQFTVTPTIGVFVPQNTFGGTYTSTLTLAIAAGP